MPLYEYACPAGHCDDCYVATHAAVVDVLPCRTCGQPAARSLARFAVLNYFSEANGRVIANLAPGVPIHSHAQHQRLMREKGLSPATDWHVSKKPSKM